MMPVRKVLLQDDTCKEGPRSNHEEVTASEDPREMLKSLRLQHSNKISDEELFLKIIVNSLCLRVGFKQNLE
ncbi:hypothetical protein M0802_005148 [Mischocyttarus mexicanus]|nr:hypothetical protein M0802_005148 [Mischocyttarus mexicanus]